MSRPIKVLLLCDDRAGHANTVLDHIDAFRRLSRHEVKTFNPVGMVGSVALDLEEFDVVVIHYSLVLSDERYVAKAFREKLKRFGGLKIQFMQDEYRWVDRATAAARDAGIRILFTAAPEPAAGQLYDQRLPGVRRVPTLTGYVPEILTRLPLKPLRERTLHVGYRGRELPFWLGRLTQEKVWIARGFLERAHKYGLRCDIGWREKDRIYGKQWISFLASARATLGTESGATIADFDGKVEGAVRDYFRAHPAAPFEEVHEAVLRPYEGNVVVNVVSPRVFEAISLGTALVMFPGEYSGVVAPDDDYIVLQKNFSNTDEVAERLKDDDFVSSLTARARHHVIESGRWSYQSFIEEFDRVVREEVVTKRRVTASPRHRLARLERTMRVPPLRVRIYGSMLGAVAAAMGWDLSRRSTKDLGSYVDKGLLAVRTTFADRDLRSLFREGRRAGLGLDRLLEEILEFSLLRKAAKGELRTRDEFALMSEFEAESGCLRFVSVPVGDYPRSAEVLSNSIRSALRDRVVKIIEWDHRAVGGTVRLEHPSIEVGIGSDGLENFALLTEIGRREPAALERALTPITDGDRTTKRTPLRS